MLLRKVFTCTTALLLLSSAGAWSEDAKPAEAPKCSAIPPKSFPSAPAASVSKQGRLSACVPAKHCKDSDDTTKAALAGGFCMMNNYAACHGGTCDKATMACMPDYRADGTKGLKLSNCVSRPSKVACPKDGEEACLCDVELEAKGSILCGCSCQLAPTPTPTAR